MNMELKKWRFEYKNELIKLCNSIDRKYLSGRIPEPYTEKDADWWLNMLEENEGKTGVYRAIFVNNEIVGTVSVEKKEDVYFKNSEIGYFLIKDCYSKGIMTKAVDEICKIAFEELDIIRITGVVYEGNIASQRVLEKNAFEIEGFQKNAVVKGEKVYNLHLYGKLK